MKMLGWIKDTGKKSTNYMTLKTLEAVAEALQKILGDGGG